MTIFSLGRFGKVPPWGYVLRQTWPVLWRNWADQQWSLQICRLKFTPSFEGGKNDPQEEPVGRSMCMSKTVMSPSQFYVYSSLTINAYLSSWTFWWLMRWALTWVLVQVGGILEIFQLASPTGSWATSPYYIWSVMYRSFKVQALTDTYFKNVYNLKKTTGCSEILA